MIYTMLYIAHRRYVSYYTWLYNVYNYNDINAHGWTYDTIVSLHLKSSTGILY